MPTLHLLLGRRLCPVGVAGANAKPSAEYMGHASFVVTFDRYGHLMPGNRDDAAALLDAYLEGRDGQG